MQTTTTLGAKQLGPIFSTTRISETKAYYESTLGFRAFFDSPTFVGLRLPGNPSVEVSFMDPRDMQGPLSSPEGLYFALGVDDVDAEHSRLWDASVEIESPPEDMPWGDRRMILRDPNGIALYISSPIEPSDEFKPFLKEA